MTKTTTGRQTATLSSLLSILARYLVWLKDRNACWGANRSLAYSTLREYEGEKEWHKEDEDLWRGRITYNEAMCVVEVLIEGLIEALKRNPFPGQRKRLLPVATELFPDAEVTFEPKVAVRGEKLWRKVFADGGISCEIDKIKFPDDAEVDVAEIEQKLLQLVGKEGYLRASEIAVVLKTKERSKVYSTARKELQERGWVWMSKRIGGVVSKVVYPP